MEILWLAIVLYSVGLGLVLHFKPPFMFNENGTWKEFGYQRSSRYTVFPFWLFAIAWAFISYAAVAAFTWMLPSDGIAGVVTTAAAVAATQFGSYHHTESDSEEEEEEEPEAAPEPVRRGRGRPRKSEGKPRQGYYVVDPESEKSGLRKYVYYGSEPPKEE